MLGKVTGLLRRYAPRNDGARNDGARNDAPRNDGATPLNYVRGSGTLISCVCNSHCLARYSR